MIGYYQFQLEPTVLDKVQPTQPTNTTKLMNQIVITIVPN